MLLRSLPIVLALTAASLAAANPALDGYANYAAHAERVKKLDESDLVSVTSLAKTTVGREIFLLTIARGDAAKKPAMVLVGNVEAPHLLGSELALLSAEKIVAGANEEPWKSLLDQVTIYVIPRPDPDATEKAFAAPYREIAGNARKTDDDRDGKFCEDPPDDLNGDGWITMMRVADDTGTWMLHPDDPRILIEADPKKNERGQYKIYTEGRDDDHDDLYNEDGGDGVAFNRNWPQRYAAFQQGVGANAVSEVESRAIADFLFERMNVFAVFSIASDDNLFHPWKPDGGKDKQKIRTTILSPDAPYHDFLAEKYRNLHGGKDAPDEPTLAGSFAEWSYFQYGRWTFSARGWWLPKVAPPMPKEGEKKPSDEKRGADELNALRWLEQEKLDGFVTWTKVENPDFPGRVVEVGGFKPFYRLNPPAKAGAEIAEKHVKFLAELGGTRPQVALSEPKVEALGGRVFRVTASVLNRGYLPTMSEMGETNGMHQRLQIQLTPPKETQFLKGSPRVKLSRIEPNASREATWLIRVPEGATKATLRTWSPECGEDQKDIELK